jgi:hypothetical protein
MARRKSRKTRRRRSTGFNLLKGAELYVQTSILTQGMFNANVIQFITGKTPVIGPGTTGNLGNAYNPSSTDSVITLPELLGMDPQAATLQGPTGYRMSIKGGSFAADPSAALATISSNLRMNAGQMIIQTIGTRAAFAVAKKLTTQQRSMINKGFKSIGLREVRV